ncbi:MAG: glycosyltransferase [archaeon]|nr:glycosyltransferase [archaeon]
MKIAYALCSWGLGHATRSLPIIRRLAEDGHEIDIICSGKPLEFLKKNLLDTVDYVEFPEPPNPFSAGGLGVSFGFSSKMPAVALSVISERRRFNRYFSAEKPQMVISDSRYGVGTAKVPSFFVSHQLTLMSPYFFRPMHFTELLNYAFKSYRKLIVPDFENDGLSGDMSHNLLFTRRKRIEYVGPLSDFRFKGVKKDVDCLISVSGPEPTRTDFEKKIFEHIGDISGNVVVSLGKAGSDVPYDVGDATVYDHMDKDTRENLMNRAKIVVSRSGYSTVMDLYVLRSKALYIPTPGQTEQECLARYLKAKGVSYFVPQKKLNFPNDLKEAKAYKGFNDKYDVEQSVDNFMDVVFN